MHVHRGVVRNQICSAYPSKWGWSPLSRRPRQTYEILYRYQAYGISRVESRDDRALARARVGALASSNLGPCLFITTNPHGLCAPSRMTRSFLIYLPTNQIRLSPQAAKYVESTRSVSSFLKWRPTFRHMVLLTVLKKKCLSPQMLRKCRMSVDKWFIFER